MDPIRSWVEPLVVLVCGVSSGLTCEWQSAETGRCHHGSHPLRSVWRCHPPPHHHERAGALGRAGVRHPAHNVHLAIGELLWRAPSGRHRPPGLQVTATNVWFMLFVSLGDLSLGTLSRSLLICGPGIGMAFVGTQLVLTLGDTRPLAIAMGSIFLCFSVWRISTLFLSSSKPHPLPSMAAPSRRFLLSTPAVASQPSPAPTHPTAMDSKEVSATAPLEAAPSVEILKSPVTVEEAVPTFGSLTVSGRSWADRFNWSTADFPSWREAGSFLLAGVLAGFLGGTLGTNGPPLMVVFSLLNTDKDRMRAICVVYNLAEAIPRFATFTTSGATLLVSFTPDHIAAICCAAAGGFLVGTFLRRYMRSEAILKGLLVLVMCSACLQLGVLSDPLVSSILLPIVAVWLILLAWFACRRRAPKPIYLPVATSLVPSPPPELAPASIVEATAV
jgi:hypothetical protein